MKIILTDNKLRKTFDIYNIIKKNISRQNIIFTSNKFSLYNILVFRKKNIILRKKKYKIFEKDLNKIILKYQNEKIVYIPIEEDTTLLFYKFISNNNVRNLYYFLPSYNNFILSRNKYSLNKFCFNHNIPAPRFFSKKEISNINNFIPVICKPKIGSGAKGIITIKNIDEIHKLNSFNENDYVIQELLPNGRNVLGAFFLMKNGKTISSYCHKRLRTFPSSGGVTVYSKVDINKKILKIGSDLLEKLNWSGFAMIEFLWDPKEKTYKVIEINPRLWGSVLLSEFANTKFIENYINLCIDKPVVVSNIDLTVKIRWLIFDVLNLINSRITFREFFTLNRKTTCYINSTYADWWSVFWFHFFFIVNISNVKKLLQKWRKK